MQGETWRKAFLTGQTKQVEQHPNAKIKINI
jgi:hypothetical protein